jgi:LacI family transcriptional regulator
MAFQHCSVLSIFEIIEIVQTESLILPSVFYTMMRNGSVPNNGLFATVMKHNLKDIANLAGVSKSTVSRVVNNQPNVNVHTRQKVLDVIRQNNFRLNSAARALVTQQTRILSVIIPQTLASTFTDPYFPSVIQSVSKVVNEHEYAMMLWIGNDTEEEERFGERILMNGMFDGALIASAVDNDPLVERLSKADFPYVLIGPPHFENANYLDVDNCTGSYRGVVHLISLRRTRIGTITGPLNMGAAKDRFSGYRNALADAGFPYDSALVFEGNFDESSGYLGAQALLQQHVDAIFAASDMMALGALRALSENGVRVPEDVSVVGFDDMPFASHTKPALTTVHQPIAELGADAARTLIRLVEGQLVEPYQVIFPAYLVVRESCGAHLIKEVDA